MKSKAHRYQPEIFLSRFVCKNYQLCVKFPSMNLFSHVMPFFMDPSLLAEVGFFSTVHVLLQCCLKIYNAKYLACAIWCLVCSCFSCFPLKSPFQFSESRSEILGLLWGFFEKGKLFRERQIMVISKEWKNTIHGNATEELRCIVVLLTNQDYNVLPKQD